MKNKYVVCPKCALTYIPKAGEEHICPTFTKEDSFDFIEKNRVKREKELAIQQAKDAEKNKYKDMDISELKALLKKEGVKGVSSMPKKMLVQKAMELNSKE